MLYQWLRIQQCDHNSAYVPIVDRTVFRTRLKTNSIYPDEHRQKSILIESLSSERCHDKNFQSPLDLVQGTFFFQWLRGPRYLMFEWRCGIGSPLNRVCRKFHIMMRVRQSNDEILMKVKLYSSFRVISFHRQA